VQVLVVVVEVDIILSFNCVAVVEMITLLLGREIGMSGLFLEGESGSGREMVVVVEESERGRRSGKERENGSGTGTGKEREREIGTEKEKEIGMESDLVVLGILLWGERKIC
jgi:hypothetical protein